MANKEKAVGSLGNILVLHGWTYSTNKWGTFLNLLEKEGFKTTLLKIPGLTKKIDRPWNLDDYVEWLNKKVGRKEAILVGHSSGGRMALAYTLKYPQKIKHLILIDSAGVCHKELFIRIKRFIFKKIAKWGKKITTSEGLRNLLYKLTGESDYKKASSVMRETMRNLMSHDLTLKLPFIKIPTLIIWGEFDNTTPIYDGKLIHQLISGSKFHIIKGAKHSPMFTHPDEVFRIIAGELK